jgi:hypothetical protein
VGLPDGGTSHDELAFFPFVCHERKQKGRFVRDTGPNTLRIAKKGIRAGLNKKVLTHHGCPRFGTGGRHRILVVGFGNRKRFAFPSLIIRIHDAGTTIQDTCSRACLTDSFHGSF